MFKKKNIYKIPEGFTEADIKIESSICTGEKTIGFYDRKSGKLTNAELVKTNDDIAAFYAKYGAGYEEKHYE